MNREQLFDLTERVKFAARVELLFIVSSQVLYGITSHVPDIVKRSVECHLLLLAAGPPAFRAVIEQLRKPVVVWRRVPPVSGKGSSPVGDAASRCVRQFRQGWMKLPRGAWRRFSTNVAAHLVWESMRPSRYGDVAQRTRNALAVLRPCPSSAMRLTRRRNVLYLLRKIGGTSR